MVCCLNDDRLTCVNLFTALTTRTHSAPPPLPPLPPPSPPPDYCPPPLAPTCSTRPLHTRASSSGPCAPSRAAPIVPCARETPTGFTTGSLVRLGRHQCGPSFEGDAHESHSPPPTPHLRHLLHLHRTRNTSSTPGNLPRKRHWDPPPPPRKPPTTPPLPPPPLYRRLNPLHLQRFSRQNRPRRRARR